MSDYPPSSFESLGERDAAELPPYDAQLAAYHRAFAGELEAIIDELPLRPGARVLDAACGDGFYTRLLARRLGPGGLAVGVDCLQGYLARARGRTAACGPETSVFVAGGIERLPFAPAAFDLAWCAQSLYSLPDPVAALRALGARVRPGGLVVVLENDALHDLILPWPAELELRVRQAELEANRAGGGEKKFYSGRNLWEVCRQAGLQPLALKTHAFDRQAPLGPDEREFLTQYLKSLAQRAGAHLDPRDRERLRALGDPDSGAALVHSPRLAFTSLNGVVWARRSDGGGH